MHFTCWVDLSHKNLNNKTYHVNKNTMCYHNTQIMPQTSIELDSKHILNGIYMKQKEQG